MLMRLAILAVLGCVVCRWALGRWPWQLLRGPSPRDAALGRARRLLGVTPGASREQIVAAHRRRIAMVHPDRGGSSDAVHEANHARDLLLGDLPAPDQNERGR